VKYVYAVLALLVGAYGLYCGWRMGAFIGTGHYWSNPWFYKGHACLFAMIALKILMGSENEIATKGGHDD